MRLRSVPPSICLILPLFLSSPNLANAAKPPTSPEPATRKPSGTPETEKAEAAATFHNQIAPLLAKYCINCHGGEKPKAGLNLATVSDPAAIAKNRKVWERVAANVESGEMPPVGKPQLGDDEISLFTQWVNAQLDRIDCGAESDPGRVTLRRLNRAEYNNTVRDLFGINFKPADDFPSDDVGYGFDNIGDVLTLPPLLFEKYLAAAESIAEQAIVVPGSSQGPTKTWEVEDLPDTAGGHAYKETFRSLASTGEIGVTHPFPRNGEYVLRVRAYGEQAGPEPVKIAFRIDGKPLHAVDVKAVESDPKVYEFRAKLRGGPRRFGVAFLNDYYNEKDPDPKQRDRNLVVDYLEVQGPIATGAPGELPESHKRIIFAKPTTETRLEAARSIVERFASRAYRRPITSGEVGRLLRFVDLAQQNGDSFERGIQLVIEAVLVSPQFLFRVELDPRRRSKKDDASPPSHPINDFELASRLSYFLWCSMPDEELTQLALHGKLREGDALDRQVKRMLRDPKAGAFVENFAEQWLQIRNVRTVNPDKAQFPGFDDALRSAMMEETGRYFEFVMREDRSIVEFIDSNYTFLNERLAHHYGIAGVQGERFRRVMLRDDRRGGLLTQASILTVTSNPTRTSPVKRGKWILEQVRGAPPPPPPPDVPELKEGKDVVLTGSLRQRMEQHRANPACASCHSKMDPLGFGLENYNAVGAWRDKDGSFPVDPSGVLPSGQKFQGPKALKAILKERQGEFVQCLAEKMLTYALGRGIEYYDRCATDRIVAGMGRGEYKFSSLVLEIVKSDPFQKRRTRGD